MSMLRSRPLRTWTATSVFPLHGWQPLSNVIDFSAHLESTHDRFAAASERERIRGKARRPSTLLALALALALPVRGRVPMPMLILLFLVFVFDRGCSGSFPARRLRWRCWH